MKSIQRMLEKKKKKKGRKRKEGKKVNREKLRNLTAKLGVIYFKAILVSISLKGGTK